MIFLYIQTDFLPMLQASFFHQHFNQHSSVCRLLQETDVGSLQLVDDGPKKIVKKLKRYQFSTKFRNSKLHFSKPPARLFSMTTF